MTKEKMLNEYVTLDELRILLAVYNSGSISCASVDIGVMPSTISRSLSRLEIKLGTSLIMRNTRKIEFTADGLKLLAHAKEITASVNNIEDEFRSNGATPSGTLRINGASPVLVHLISPILKKYLTQYPQVNIELQNNEEIIDIIEKKVDIALRVAPLTENSYQVTHIGSSKRRLLASSEYLRQYGFPNSIEDLNNHILLGLEGPSILNTWPIEDGKSQNLRVSPRVVASSGEVLRKMTLSGTGIACITDFMTKADRNSGKLIEVLKDQTIDEKREISAVCYRGTSSSIKVLSFIEFLKKELPSLL
ncbi:MAG: LysR family transcriptional regulator [Shewanella psychromarinicola]|jgi:DNA-binding transcriptional LysR family regulator|uniref:LysR family transcriptional regulator n=1 Tax=Shewanella TaxID=22 RepID=UPI000C32E75F|nr:LysR family transcriptional regulator [Shewanella sp. Actino-trap-3]PKG77449.1 LysR family transcriptional regulator [Shewanella sp. Actino-trap-3]|tara:strand:+ start:233212 stop:234129 length:918 start_codon:yes stop_codon:yes gene_type:complete